MFRPAFLLASLLTVACGGDDDASDASTSIDASALADAATIDADTTDAATIDADTTDAATIDADTTDADTTDADTTDAPLPTELGPIDCVGDSDCPGASTTCTMNAPGGICFGCDDSLDCPTDLSCSIYNSCIRSCDDDDDCSDGKKCSTVSNRCAMRSCASAPCPYPYVCSVSDKCDRPPCSGGTCPPPMTCDVASDYCVEPAL